MKNKYLLSVLIIVGIGVGLLLTAQWKVPQVRSVNPIASYLALRDTRNDLTTEQKKLKNSIANLQKIADSASVNNTDQSKELVKKSLELKKKVGLTDVSGSGIIIKLDDAETGIGTVDSITHAADLRDIVNVLWLNGAEAISINGERVVANSSIDCIVNTILINSTKTAPPFTILAIGDSYKLKKAIEENKLLADLWKRNKSSGIVLEVKTSWRVNIKAFNGSYLLKHAKGAD